MKMDLTAVSVHCRYLLMLITILFPTAAAFSQSTIEGRVTDSASNEGLWKKIVTSSELVVCLSMFSKSSSLETLVE